MTSGNTAAEPDAKSYQISNEFVRVISAPYETLDAVQRPAHLVLLYESEVHNGGHLQYFENIGTDKLEETVLALNLLGASCQAKVLSATRQMLLESPRKKITSPDEFVASALEGRFDVFDKSFHACSPTLTTCLESYLEVHLSAFRVK